MSSKSPSLPGVLWGDFLSFLTSPTNPNTVYIFPGKYHLLPGLCMLMNSKSKALAQFSFWVTDIFTYMSHRQIKFTTPKRNTMLSPLQTLLCSLLSEEDGSLHAQARGLTFISSFSILSHSISHHINSVFQTYFQSTLYFLSLLLLPASSSFCLDYCSQSCSL